MSFKSGVSIDNTSLKFLELKKYLISSNGSNGLNSICVDNSQQNVFIINDNNLVVIQLNSLLSFDWNKSVLNEICQQFQHFSIGLAFRAHLISVSAKGFGNKLAVCGSDGQNESPFIVFYDLKEVNKNENKSTHYSRINLVNSCGLVSDIVWHPEMSDNQFGCCLTDGSVFIISIGDLDSKSTTIMAYIAAPNNALSLCWSPKGKQLVCGHRNGYFSQYKLIGGQQLQEVKKTLLGTNFSDHRVIAIKWIVSSLFAIAVTKDVSETDKDTHILLVSTPSKGVPHFLDFGAICLDNYEMNGLFRIDLLLFENMILCSTSMASEVTVIGCDADKDISVPDNWCQWILEDSSRIDLPMDSEGNDTYMRGIVVSKGTQNVYKINSNETYGGVNCPVLLVYNSSGILVPYLMIDRTGRLKGPAPTPIAKPALVGSASAHMRQMTSTPIVAQSTGHQSKTTSKPMAQTFSSPVTPVLSSTPTEPIFGQKSEIKALLNQTPIKANEPPLRAQPSVPQTIQSSNQSTDKMLKSESTAETTTVSANELYMNAIKEQIIEFKKLMTETNRKYSQIKVKIGEKSEQMRLRVDTRRVEEVLQEIKDNFRNCAKDATTLQSSLIESFSLLEEAKSIMDRNVDPKYRHLLKQRALDPITARRMQEIHSLNEYIEIQLRELDAKFEQEWYEWLEKRKEAKTQPKNRIQSNSNLELIYKALANNQRVINALRLQLDALEGLSSPSRPKSRILLPLNESSDKAKIEKLTQSLSKSSIKEIPENIENDRVFQLKTISYEKKQNLINFFENRTKVPVRRSVDNSSYFISAIEKLKEKQKNMESIRLSQTKVDSNVANEKSEQKSEPKIASLDNKVIITPTVVNVSKTVEKAVNKTRPEKPTLPIPKLEPKLTPLTMLLRDTQPSPQSSSTPFSLSATKPTELFASLASKPLSFNLNTTPVMSAPKAGPPPVPALTPLFTPKAMPTQTVVNAITTKPKSDINSNKKESLADSTGPSVASNVSKTVSFGNTTIINPIETSGDESFKLDTISELSESNESSVNITSSPFSSFKGFGGSPSSDTTSPKLSFNLNQSNKSFSFNLRGDSKEENTAEPKESVPKFEDISPPTTPIRSLPNKEQKTDDKTSVATEEESSDSMSILKTTLSTKSPNIEREAKPRESTLASLISSTQEADPSATTTAPITAISPPVSSSAPVSTQSTPTFLTQTASQSTTNTTITDKQSNEMTAQSTQQSEQISSPFSSSAFGQTPFASNSFSFGNITSNANQTAPTFGASQGFSFGGSTGFGAANQTPAVANQSSASTAVSTGSLSFGQQSTALNNLSFCGLGGRPNAENAQKNAFGGAFSSPPLQTSQFTPTSQASPFGVKTSPTSGAFGGSFTSGSGVGQTGFAAFQPSPQQSPVQPTQPVFGGSPLFGGSPQQPAFGSPPAFGGSPQQTAFGSVPTFGGAPALGAIGANQSTGSFGATPGFANMANSNLSFGALASGAAQPQQQNTSPFGSGFSFPNSNPSAFGAQNNSFSFTQRRK